MFRGVRFVRNYVSFISCNKFSEARNSIVHSIIGDSIVSTRHLVSVTGSRVVNYSRVGNGELSTWKSCLSFAFSVGRTGQGISGSECDGGWRGSGIGFLSGFSGWDFHRALGNVLLSHSYRHLVGNCHSLGLSVGVRVGCSLLVSELHCLGHWSLRVINDVGSHKDRWASLDSCCIHIISNINLSNCVGNSECPNFPR